VPDHHHCPQAPRRQRSRPCAGGWPLCPDSLDTRRACRPGSHHPGILTGARPLSYRIAAWSRDSRPARCSCARAARPG
jgi:hypothetical protein